MILDAVVAALLGAAAPAAPSPSPAATAKPAATTGAAAAASAAPDRPVVVMETSLGRIRLALFKDRAPETVANFLRYVRAGHYDGTVFHRVIPDFMIQGGGLDPDLAEKPTRPPVRNEARTGGRNRRGTIAMARTPDPHSATAQYFINLKDNHGLDFGVSPDGWGYAVFGEVVEGLEVVDRIAQVPTTAKGSHEAVPRVPVVIKSVREAAP